MSDARAGSAAPSVTDVEADAIEALYARGVTDGLPVWTFPKASRLVFRKVAHFESGRTPS